jgi:hypothetical protein
LCHAQVWPHRLELAFDLMLLLANGMEEQRPARNLHIEQRHFPVIVGNFRLDDFESSSLCSLPKIPNPNSTSDTNVNSFPVQDLTAQKSRIIQPGVESNLRKT